MRLTFIACGREQAEASRGPDMFDYITSKKIKTELCFRLQKDSVLLFPLLQISNSQV